MDKYSLLNQAHENIDSIINVISKFEGVNFTIPQTRKIINHQRNEKVFQTNYDYRVIWTLKQAFMDIEDQIRFRNGDNFDHNYALRLNYTLTEYDVLKPGEFNTFHADVDIGNNKFYKPRFLTVNESIKLIDDVAISDYTISSVVDLLGKMITHQIFNDANKRTALLFCNALLLKKNLAFIDLNNMELFNKILNDLYWGLLNKQKDCYKIFNKLVVKNFVVNKIEQTKIKSDGFKTVSCILSNESYDKFISICKYNSRTKSSIIKNIVNQLIYKEQPLNVNRTKYVSRSSKIVQLHHISCRIKYDDYAKLVNLTYKRKSTIYKIVKNEIENFIKINII